MVTVDNPLLSYKPNSQWNKIHSSKAKWKIIKAARRGGKSRGALMEMERIFGEDALGSKAPPSLVPPFHAWVVCPSFPLSRQAWNEALSFTPKSWVQRVVQDERIIYLEGNENRPWGMIEFKSADNPYSLQSAGLDLVWVNEAQDVSQDAWERLLPALRSPDRMGKLIVEGIPALWSDHWFEMLFQQASRGDNPDREAFHWTYLDNEMLTDEDKREVESYREVLSQAAWKRMFMAEFSEGAGYFSNISNCISGDILQTPIPGARYVAGLDLGRKHDATVLVIMDAEHRRVASVLTIDQGEVWPVQKEQVRREAEYWGIERMFVDATGLGGDMFTQELQAIGLSVEPYTISSVSRDVLLSGLVVATERETIHFPNYSKLVRELQSFQMRRLPSGRWRPEAPPGEHDDHVFALALALEAADPWAGDQSVRRKSMPWRYVQTQEEATGIGSQLKSRGAKLMAERRSEGIIERARRAGVYLP